VQPPQKTAIKIDGHLRILRSGRRFGFATQSAFSTSALSLGYPQPAVAQLDKVIELEPRDEMAAQLRTVVAPRLPAPEAPVITPGVVTPARHR